MIWLCCCPEGLTSFSRSAQYGIVLDAGSSHTAMYVYKWPADKQNDTGIVTQHDECHVKGRSSTHFWNLWEIMKNVMYKKIVQCNIISGNNCLQQYNRGSGAFLQKVAITSLLEKLFRVQLLFNTSLWCPSSYFSLMNALCPLLLFLNYLFCCCVFLWIP